LDGRYLPQEEVLIQW